MQKNDCQRCHKTYHSASSDATCPYCELTPEEEKKYEDLGMALLLFLGAFVIACVIYQVYLYLAR